MPLVYSLSNTIDLSKLNKKIYVDTNAIADLYYPNASYVPNSNSASKQPYHIFIRDLFSANKVVHITTQTLLEMEHVFLKFDYRIYQAQNKGTSISLKDFRAIPSEMSKRKVAYSQYYGQIFGNKMINCVDTCTTQEHVTNYLNSLDSQSLDANDYLLLRCCQDDDGILITDDCDFATSIATCDIITNNSQLITKATTLGFTLGN